MLNRLSFLIIPPILLALVLGLAPLSTQMPKAYLPLVNVLPYFLMLTALGLAWRFNRSRAFFAVFVLLLSYLLMQPDWSRDQERLRWLSLAAALLLPLNLAMLAVLKERGIFTVHGWIRLGVIAGEGLLLVWLLYMAGPGWVEAAYAELLPSSWQLKLSAPDLAQLVMVVAMLVLVGHGLLRPNMMSTVLFSCLLLGFAAQAVVLSSQVQALMFSLCAVLMVVVLVQESYGMAYLDELTGLPGRRAINQTLAGLGSRYAIAMLDVDHFKKFNDTHGHDVGDQVLRMVAERISEVGGGGRAARYGGEEFCIIFPNKEIADVFAHLDVVREKIATTPFVIRGKDRPKKAPTERKPRKASGKQVQVTISIGVAERTAKLGTPDQVMKAADKALYRAKEGGRNQVAK